MPGPSSLQRQSLALLLVFACCLLGRPTLSSAEEAPTAAGSGGLKVHVDPNTGRIIDKPAADAAPAAPQASAPAPPPLEIRKNPIPGGGYGFRNPDGRFDADIKASTAPDGSTHVGCREQDHDQ